MLVELSASPQKIYFHTVSSPVWKPMRGKTLVYQCSLEFVQTTTLFLHSMVTGKITLLVFTVRIIICKPVVGKISGRVFSPELTFIR